MRKRNWMLGLVAAMAISVVAPMAAHATIAPGLPTTITPDPSPTKQEKKARGGLSLGFTTTTAHVAPFTVLQPAASVAVDFDRNFAFNAGNKDECSAVELSNTDTATARARCGSSQVGDGFATTIGTAGDITQETVSAFNGAASGRGLQLLLHVRITQANTTLVLPGNLVNSPLGGQYGKRLDVSPIQNSTPTGRQLETFHVDIPKQVTKKKKKKLANGKKKTIKTFYLSAKCSGDKVWQFSSVNNHYAGPTTSDTAEVPCKQKKRKKK